jgi:hypothetical protein
MCIDECNGLGWRVWVRIVLRTIEMVRRLIDREKPTLTAQNAVKMGYPFLVWVGGFEKQIPCGNDNKERQRQKLWNGLAAGGWFGGAEGVAEGEP